MNDPIVKEVRENRDQHAKSFNYDIKEICKDMKNKHEDYVKLLKTRELV